MAVNSYWYCEGIKNLLTGNISFGTNTFRVALLNGTSYGAITTTILRTHDSYADVTTAELTAAGNYSVGGVNLSVATTNVKVDTTNGAIIVGDGATNSEWTSATFTARYAVVYEYNATPANAFLLGVIDFGADQTCSNGSFTIDWATEGIFKFTPTGV